MIYLGNFGPEISETLLAKYFDGPVMFVATAEEIGRDLVQGCGDAYCGMLNASYNLCVEIEENSELDLFEVFNKHEGDPRIPLRDGYVTDIGMFSYSVNIHRRNVYAVCRN